MQREWYIFSVVYDIKVCAFMLSGELWADY